MPVLAPRMPGKLAKAAFELFSERGVRHVNLDAIAARAGVTKGSLYHHYGSKKELVLAGCRHYYQQWHQHTQAQIASLTKPLERLATVLSSSVRTCVIDEKNRVFTTEIFALALSDPDVRAGWAQFYGSVRETYVGLVQAAKAAGKLDVDDPRRATDLMLATMEGIKQRASFEPEISDPAEQQAIVADLLGILGARSSARTAASVVP